MPQMAALVNTRCSYSATSAPSERGVSESSISVVLGRLPGKVRCAASVAASSVADAVGAFSARAASAVLPSISAWLCASPLASSLACRPASVCAGRLTRMNSTGITSVPWCSIWK